MAMTIPWLQEWHYSRTLVLCIVTVILILDNLFSLMTVPILPKVIQEFEFLDMLVNYKENQYLSRNFSGKGLNAVTHRGWADESMLVGIVIAGKSAVQVISNPIVGSLTYEFGYSIPLFVAFVLLFFSTFLFAVAANFTVLLSSRLLQGVATSCARVAGFGVLAEKYADDAVRGKAMRIALGGIVVGPLIGPLLGGTLYDIIGRTPLFLCLGGVVFIGGFAQLTMVHPDVDKNQNKEDGTSLKRLLKDPYILIAAGGLFYGNMTFGVLEASLPLWMTNSMDASSTAVGAAFIPYNFAYLISIYLILPWCCKSKRWFTAMMGLFLLGFSQLMLPAAQSFNSVILPTALTGFFKSMVDTALIPELAHLVDLRHSCVYGNVYALSDMATAVGFIIGPLISGTIMSTFGFHWLMVFMAALCLVFAPMMFFLGEPLSKAEHEALVKQ